MRSERYLAFALTAALALGCKSDPGSAEREGRGEQARSERAAMVLPLGPTPISLDPIEAADADARRVVAALYDTVVDWDVDANEPTALRPELTELPTLDEAGITLVLEMKRGPNAGTFAAADCLDAPSRAVRPSDVRASWLRLAASPSQGLLAGRVEGWDAYAHAKLAGEEAPDPAIEADDEAGTVSIRLTRPQPEFPQLLANPHLAVVPAECASENTSRERAHLRERPVGSGPFVLVPEESEPGRHLVLRRREGHPRPAKSKTLQLTHIRSPATALRLFQSGELAMLAPGRAEFELVVREGALVPEAVPEGTALRTYTEPKTTMLLFRLGDPVVGRSDDPATDERHRALREAISLAFDGPRYHALVRNGVWAEPAARVVPPGVEGASGEALYPAAPSAPDLEAAKRALAAAGASAEAEVVYATTSDPTAHLEADLFRESLRAIGVKLNVEHDDHYLARMFEPENRTAVFALRFDADYLGASTFLRAFGCQGQLRPFTDYCDPSYDELLDALDRAPEHARAEAARAAEEHLAAALVVRPLDHPILYVLVAPDVEGVVRHPIAGLRLEKLAWRAP